MLTNSSFDKRAPWRAIARTLSLHLPMSLAWLLAAKVPAQSYRVLHAFAGGGDDGALPYSGLALYGTTLYGTTQFGGTSGSGSIFKIQTDGTGYTILHNFAPLPLSETNVGGAQPSARLVVADSWLYGTTYWGGSFRWGTVFKLNTNGTGFTVLKEFTGPDGASPTGALVLSGTTLYGNTWRGGSNYNQQAQNAGAGSIFKLNTDGSDFAVLKSFNEPDGRAPTAGLLLSGTTLYGVTRYDGASGAGTVFQLNTDGTVFSVVGSFPSGSGNSSAGVVLSGSTLYGAAGGGNPLDCCGTIFQLNVDGASYEVLESFTNLPGYTSGPGTLVLAGDTLLGTTYFGGASNAGTIFEVHTDGTGSATLKECDGGLDGANPAEVGWNVGLVGARLVCSGGIAYGTTSGGGAFGQGVVFSLALPPLVLESPASQTAEEGSTVGFGLRVTGAPPLVYQWLFDATNVLGGATTNPVFQITNVQFSQAGAYTVVVTNSAGAVTSPPAGLSVIQPVERRTVPALSLIGQPGSWLSLLYSTTLGPAPAWATLDTVALTNAFQWYFDLSAPLPSLRFYRAWQTNTLSPPPDLDLNLVPAITLTGTAGSSVRVDYINRVGPTNAWVTLATETLTNTLQLYFDVSAIGEPPRLYRLVPIP